MHARQKVLMDNDAGSQPPGTTTAPFVPATSRVSTPALTDAANQLQRVLASVERGCNRDDQASLQRNVAEIHGTDVIPERTN